MKNRKKRGFTIVELVIVIAVIAILAAVLIPTFSGVIEKANNSADIQLIRQANTVLAAMEAYGTEITFANAKTELEANGIDMTVSPSNENNAFCFLEDRKCYVIWSKTESKISFPEEMTALNWKPTSVAVVNGTYCDTLHAAVNAASAGDTVLVIKDITTDQQIDITKSIVIDFSGHTCTFNYSEVEGDYKYTSFNANNRDKGFLVNDANAKVKFKNGTIKCGENGIHCAIVLQKGELTLNSVCIDVTAGAQKMRTPIYGMNGSLTFINSEIKQSKSFSLLIESQSTFNLTTIGNSEIGKTYLRRKKIVVTTDENTTINFILENGITETVLMKLGNSNYPTGDWFTWSEPNENGYKTLQKNK